MLYLQVRNACKLLFKNFFKTRLYHILSAYWASTLCFTCTTSSLQESSEVMQLLAPHFRDGGRGLWHCHILHVQWQGLEVGEPGSELMCDCTPHSLRCTAVSACRAAAGPCGIKVKLSTLHTDSYMSWDLFTGCQFCPIYFWDLRIIIIIKS